jgi:hypothetical protein
MWTMFIYCTVQCTIGQGGEGEVGEKTKRMQELETMHSEVKFWEKESHTFIILLCVFIS